MFITNSHEVSIDAAGHGRDVWTCKWSGGDKAQIFRGDFINNRILQQHLLTLKCPAFSTVEKFWEWAENILILLIEEELNPDQI